VKFCSDTQLVST